MTLRENLARVYRTRRPFAGEQARPSPTPQCLSASAHLHSPDNHRLSTLPLSGLTRNPHTYISYDDMNTCLRCNHQWEPRTKQKPKQCPGCKSPRWWLPITTGGAHAKVQMAVQRGDLPALDGSVACVDCGQPATDYDHRDYSKPLDVDPVCHVCNLARGPALNGIGGLVRMSLTPDEAHKFKVWCAENKTSASAFLTKKIKSLLKRENNA